MGEHNGVIGGVSEIVAVDFTPWWEGIEGTVSVDHATGDLSPQEAYERVLNWQVLEREVWVDVDCDDEDIGFVTIPNKKALVRADTKKVLGVHSEGFHVVQNEILVEFAEALKLVGSDVLIKSAGGLFDGAVVWILAKLGEDKHFLDRDERIAKYFAVSNGHDGQHKFRACPTPVRIECMNTFASHLSAKATVDLRHTSKMADRLKQAKKVVDAQYAHSAELDAEIELLLSTPFAPTTYKDVLVPAINPKPEPEAGEEEVSKRKLTNWRNRTDGLVNAYYRSDAENIRGTAWGALMGVNSYELWTQTVKGNRLESQADRAFKGSFPLTSQARTLINA